MALPAVPLTTVREPHTDSYRVGVRWDYKPEISNAEQIGDLRCTRIFDSLDSGFLRVYAEEDVNSTGVTHDVVVAGFRGDYRLIVSEETLAEFEDTLRKYPEKFNMDEQDIRTEVTTVRMFAEFVDPDVDLTVVTDDPDDDKFLEAAVAGDADYLVSGDSHLLELDSYRDIQIVDPRRFSEKMSSQ